MGEMPLKDGALRGLRDALKASEPVSVTPGDTIGRYRVDALLGRGGAGVIYRAYDSVLERQVALKVLRSDILGPGRIARFHREASAAARLTHPNIVKVHEVVSQEALHFISMEFVDGETLTEFMKREVSDRRRFVDIIEQVARAVDYAHRQGVIHRDLKPHNILMRPDGRPALTDFGLAKLEDGQTTLTQTGFILGTPLYMSPEQVRGTDVIDARTDVYSLGVILYEGLTGRAPFTGTDPGQIYHRILDSEPPTLKSIVPDVPAALEHIVLQCLTKDPARRYQTALALAEDLKRWRTGGAVSAKAPTWSASAGRFIRKHRTSFVGLSLTLLAAVLVGLLLVVRHQLNVAAEARLAQEREAKLAELYKRKETAFSGAQDLAPLLDELAAAAKAWPKDPRPHIWTGQAHGRLRQEDQAEASLRLAVEIDPKSADARLELAALLMRRYHRLWGTPTGFIKEGGVAGLRFPQETPALARIRDEAQSHLAAAATDSSQPLRHYVEGSIAVAATKLPLASEKLDAYLRQAPWDVEALQLGARVLYFSGELKRAETHLNRASALAPDRPEILMELGKLLTDLGEYTRGQDLLERALLLDKDSTAILVALGEIHAYLADRKFAGDRKGAETQYRKALGYFDRALGLDVKYAPARIGRGHAHSSMRRFKEQVEDLTLALALDDRSVVAFMNRGRAFIMLDRFEEAVKDCLSALELDPNNAWILRNLGQAQMQAGRTKEAVTTLQRSLALQPEVADAWALLGAARLSLDDVDGAIAAQNQALKYDARSSQAFYNRGQARFVKKDYSGAIDDFSQAIDIEREAPHPRLGRGIVRMEFAVRMNAGDDRRRLIEQAIEDFEECLRLQPKGPIADQARTLLHKAQATLDES